MTVDRVPYGAIRWLVGHYHVSADADAIAQDVITRLENSGATAAELDRAAAYARKCHAENRGLYVDVMGGNI